MTGFLDGGGLDEVSSGVDTGDIGHSLRFRGGQCLIKTTPNVTFKKASLNLWVKRSTLGTDQCLFGFGSTGTGYVGTYLRFNTSNQLEVICNDSVNAVGPHTASAIYRDVTSEFNVHLRIDTTQAVAANRLIIDIGSNSYPIGSAITLNADLYYWSNSSFGCRPYYGDQYFGGYISRACLVFGSTPLNTEFIYLNTQSNDWVSKTQSAIKAVVDAGSANSFMLDFDDGTSLTTLGYDKSSKGNDWTLNNFSLTPGVNYDWMLERGYATLNLLDTYSGTTLSNGALVATAVTGYRSTSTQSIPPNSKIYCEFENSSAQNSNTGIGVGIQSPTTDLSGGSAAAGSYHLYSSSYAHIITNTVASAPLSGYVNLANQTYQLAVDSITGKVWIGQNDVWRDSSGGTTGNPSTGANPTFTLDPTGFKPFSYIDSTSSISMYARFGQAPLHASATYHSDAGGYFRYTPPTGYKALCTANLPTPSITNPIEHHNEYLVTKSGDTSFTLDWDASVYDTFFEIKRRDAAGSWYQIDGLRGYDKYLSSNSTAAEITDANVIGVIGNQVTLKSSLANGTYLISATKAGKVSERATNTAGSITSTVSANVLSGFSIVTYTGTGANATVGHGLGAVLGMTHVKNRSGTNYWITWHKAFASHVNNVYLNDTSSVQSDGNYTASVTATLLSLAANKSVNVLSNNYVAYCYADSAIQKSFSYMGNGSADGTYVNLGFKCGRTLFKNISSGTAGDIWSIWDSARSTSNVIGNYLEPSSTLAEAAYVGIDFTANGFKWRGANTTLNGSGQTYIGHAWAAVPGKYSNAR